MSTAVANRSKRRVTQPRGRATRQQVVEVTKRLRTVEEIGANAPEALQEVLDLYVIDLRFAQAQVDRLERSEYWRDTIVGKVPNEWIRLRDEYADRLERLAREMSRLGLSDRLVKVKEAEFTLLATNVIEAAKRAGLDPAAVRSLGTELRKMAEEEANDEAK